MKLTQKNFENILIFFLVVGCTTHPASCAAGFLILALSQIAERYFTKNISDADRNQLKAITADVQKHAMLLQKENLSKAFGGKQ